MKKILVAVDGSDASDKAARMAADIARGTRASVTLVHVLNPLWIPPETYGLNVTTIQAAHAKEGRRILAEAERKLDAPSLQVDHLLLEGLPADALADNAKESGYDLLVMGSRGQGAVTRLMLGSVSSRLAHICRVPLLIVYADPAK